MGEERARELQVPSAWVVRWAPLVPAGPVLDVACGLGRHSHLFLDLGHDVVAVDRESRDIPGARFVQADLEGDRPWPLPGESFAGIVVTNYLHRPLLPVLASSLRPCGVLIYETFMRGHERYRTPSNPDFLLEPDELRGAFAGLEVLGFEQGPVQEPKPAVIQRICVRAPAGE